MDLTGIGIWSSQLRYGNPAESADAAAELDELGFRALWIPDVGGAVFDAVGNLLASTKQTTVATGILNLWMHTPSDVAASYAELTAAHGDRFLLGIGVSHAPVIDAGAPGRYRKPLAATASFLDELDATPQPVPTDRRVLAALGPKMLTLSARRAAGAHPYLVTPEHTARAREILGAGPVLAPELKVVLAIDTATGREIARSHLQFYFQLPNYVNSLRRLGFTDDDFSDGGSDRLVDATVAIGDEDVVSARLKQHFDAGA